MFNKTGFWQLNTTPNTPGWYAILKSVPNCYGCDLSPGAAFWDGTSWGSTDIVAFGELRPSKEAAEDLAYVNDPDD